MELIISRLDYFDTVTTTIIKRTPIEVKDKIIKYTHEKKYKLLTDFVNRKIITEDIADLAAENNIIGLVKYLKHKGIYVRKYGLNLAVAGGFNHMKMIKYLLSPTYKQVRELKINREGINEAAGNGHIDLVKFLSSPYTINGVEYKKLRVGRLGINLAVEKGHLEMVKWLQNKEVDSDESSSSDSDFISESDSDSDSDMLEIDDDIIDVAAENGHLDMIKYLKETKSFEVSQYGLNKAARNGHIKIVEYVEMNNNFMSVKIEQNTIDESAYHNDVEVMKYFEDRCIINDGRNEKCMKVSQSGIDYAARFNNIKMVKYLSSTERGDDRLEVGLWGIELVIITGQIEMFKYLESVYENIEIDQDMMNKLIKTGNLEMVKYILGKYKDLIFDRKILKDNMKLIYDTFYCCGL